MRPACISEDQEQAAFVQWFRCQWPKVLIAHFANGGSRNKAEAAKLKRIGVVPGMPDLFIPEWKLFIEMKRRHGGVVSKEQKAMIEYLVSVGYQAYVARGYDEAMDICRDVVSNMDKEE